MLFILFKFIRSFPACVLKFSVVGKYGKEMSILERKKVFQGSFSVDGQMARIPGSE
jgi:hypothetical protein